MLNASAIKTNWSEMMGTLEKDKCIVTFAKDCDYVKS
jgi:hypothetical protein